MEFKLVTSQKFGNVPCDFYKNEAADILMTRKQIGEALGYADPVRSISKLHDRHSNRLNKFSAVDKLTTTDGKNYETILYTAKGIYEICRHSKQHKANEFFDFVYEILEKLRLGETQIVSSQVTKPLTEKEQIIAAMKVTIETSEELTYVKSEVKEIRNMVQEQITLDHGEQRRVQKGISIRVYEVADKGTYKSREELQKGRGRLFSEIYKDVKDRFGVASYKDIKRKDMQDALRYIDSWIPKKVGF